MGRLPGSRALSPATAVDPVPIDEERSFREPWQAKAFAMVVLLHRKGHFAWDEWVRILADEIAQSPQTPGETADQAYHRQFLAGLERLVATRRLAEAEAVEARTAAWRRAYLNTPHGQPVDLAAAEMPEADHGHDEHHHHHHHHLEAQRRPITVVPGRSRG